MCKDLRLGDFDWDNLALGLVTNERKKQGVADYDFLVFLIKLSGKFQMKFFDQKFS